MQVVEAMEIVCQKLNFPSEHTRRRDNTVLEVTDLFETPTQATAFGGGS
jgi:hypothetical protein